jgi:aminoglycoside phosphotransferase (APT) family kinase protein
VTPAEAAESLGCAGVRVRAADIRLVRRDDRWLVHLPGARLAWFAASGAARERMAVERRILRVLEMRCRFAVPRVLYESRDGWFDVRTMVPGIHGMHDAFAIFQRVRADSVAATRIGAALGAMLAEQHTQVPASDVAAWLPHRPSWPESRASIRDRLPAVVDDLALHAAADRVIAQYEELIEIAPPTDHVLVHTDLGFHNMGVDSTTLEVTGIFDWEAACWADRHLDFRYLVLDDDRETHGDRHTLLEAALKVYEPAAGMRISRARVLLHHAACAIGYLAYRAGVPADERWCGRTLAEDLHWTCRAIARTLATPSDA